MSEYHHIFLHSSLKSERWTVRCLWTCRFLLLRNQMYQWLEMCLLQIYQRHKKLSDIWRDWTHQVAWILQWLFHRNKRRDMPNTARRNNNTWYVTSVQILERTSFGFVKSVDKKVVLVHFLFSLRVLRCPSINLNLCLPIMHTSLNNYQFQFHLWYASCSF